MKIALVPCSWYDIYDFLSYLYPKRKHVDTCSNTVIMQTESRSTLPVEYDKIFVNMPVINPDIVFADSNNSVLLERHRQSTITDLPHVTRVISGQKAQTEYYMSTML